MNNRLRVREGWKVLKPPHGSGNAQVGLKNNTKIRQSDDVASLLARKATPFDATYPAEDCCQGGETVLMVKALKNRAIEPFWTKKATFLHRSPLDAWTLLRIDLTPR